MEIGVALRLMGDSATRELVGSCAHRAEQAGLDALWLPDHVAIPPDDAEGSNGRYLDILASLGWLAGITERIGLGTGVLVLPYRRPLPTAKAVATIQELSGGRLRLGVGVGWMDAEFRALGIERSRRGRDSDAVLELLCAGFEAEDDVVSSNGQPFLFRPHPARPPILVGGAGSHSLERATRFGDGWMPMLADPEQLAAPIAELRERFEAAGKPEPQVVTYGGIPPGELQAGLDLIGRLSEVGVTSFIQGLGRYETEDEFAAGIEPAARLRAAL
jgi:probable F420-dependent oxidoreductase